MPTHGNLPIYYPKHINLYRQCPERYFHEYVERTKASRTVDAALAKGIAAHYLLDGIAREYQKSVARAEGYDGPAVPADLVARAEAVLPRAPYPSDGSWRLDARSLAEDVKYGISYFDGEAEVLASEATFFFRYERARDCPPFVLAAKVDLVLLRHDAEGRPYLDVVDFKSGKSLKPDPIQEVAARIVVKQNASRFGQPYSFIQSTTISLGARAQRSAVIEAEECGRWWSEIKSVVTAIQEGSDWSPQPSPLCGWCASFNNGCSLTPIGREADDLGEWLDGVAD